MDQLLSGLFGALIASILSIIYLYFSAQIKVRAEVMLEVVGYSDDIYNYLQMMHAHKHLIYTENKPALTDDEYRNFSNQLSVLLKSSKVKAKIALVHGEGNLLEIFNELWGNYLAVSSILRNATRSAWVVKENKEIFELFSNRIDPLRNKLEIALLNGARVSGVAKTLFSNLLPYILQKKEIGVSRDKGQR